MKNGLFAFTDYPDGTKLVGCKILSYDHDKYCTVLVNGETKEIKRGYLYRDRKITTVRARNSIYTMRVCFSHGQLVRDLPRTR